MKLRSLLLYMLILSCSFSYGQQAENDVQYDKGPIARKTFNQDHLESYKKDKSFQYEVVHREPNAIEKFWNWLMRGVGKLLSWIFGNEQAGHIMVFILKILPYLLLAILLFLIVKFFMKLDSRQMISGKVKKSSIKIDDHEALMTSTDLNKLLDEAIAQKKYRLAVRYYYLIVLKELSNKELIDWHQEKTNEDYIKEIKKGTLKEKFKASTYLYDFVWYGNFELDEFQFAQASSDFIALKNSIA